MKERLIRLARTIAIGLCLFGSARFVRAQCQVDKVTASDANANDRYGWSVAVNGDYAVVGADRGDGGGSTPLTDTGAAFLLRRDGLNWVEIQQLVPKNEVAGDAFGASVAVSDNAELIVVGALKAEGSNSVTTAGAVYVFKRYQDSFRCFGDHNCSAVGLTTCTNGACEGLTWAVETKLFADDPQADDDFGFSVDISGDVVVVGADRTDEGDDANTGAAYVFRRYQESFPCASDSECQSVGSVFTGTCVLEQGLCAGVTWKLDQKLTVSDALVDGFFGTAVAVEGNRIAVGAKSVFEAGRAYVFEHDGSGWDEVQKLTASDRQVGDSFGQDVDLHGELLVVTAMSADIDGALDVGKVYVYRSIGDSFGDERILTASSPASTDRFGRSASLHGDNLLIGARDTDTPSSRAGSAYLFSFDGIDWNEIEEIRADDAAGNDRFGHAVSLSETYAIVGAYREDDGGLDAGAAYLFAIGLGPASGLGRDCNHNLVPDDCDVLDGTELDLNNNGTPDSCECHSDSDCAGGDACSIATCNQDSLCELAVIAGFCRIDGVCHVDGEADPNNSCRVCNASVDQECFTPIGGAPTCEDDGNECTRNVCVLGVCTPQSMEVSACSDDGDNCTRDVCVSGVCDHRVLYDGFVCDDDGNDCSRDVCLAGVCIHQFLAGAMCGEQINRTCTSRDTCDSAGNCLENNWPTGTNCPDDGNPCTQSLCDGLGNCVVSDRPVGTVCTGDGNPCTESVCDGVGNCEVLDLPEGTSCPSDGNPCTVNECDGAGTCIANDQPQGTNCPDDGNPCADNVCDGVGICVAIDSPEGIPCPDDENECTESVCDGLGNCGANLPGGSACTDDGNPCTNDVCDGAGICEHVRDDTLVCLGIVNSHQKISDTQGGFTGALDDFDAMGSSVAFLGDLDGDGIGDLAVGAVGDDDGGSGRGAVWILFLDSEGTVKSQQKISATEGGFTGALDDGDSFGASVALLGDLDGDGVDDLAVGAPGEDDGGSDRGAVWILFLNADRTVKSHQRINSTEGGFTGTLKDFSFFGTSVAALGDLDGDGVGDLAVGAPGLDSYSWDGTGTVWILFLNPDGTVKSHRWIISTQSGPDEFGSSIASLEDLDGDGVGDLVVGATSDNDGDRDSGAVWVVFLNTDGTVKSRQKISATQGGFTGTLVSRDRFGASVTSLGDLDGDGVIDLAVGASRDREALYESGAVWILSLNTDGTVKWQQKINGLHGNFSDSLYYYDWFGTSVAAIGDLNGDGVNELAVGASGDRDGGGRRGAVWVLFLDGTSDECLDVVAGTPCTDDDNPCTEHECDGAGRCGVIYLQEGTACPDDGNECTANVCDGNDRCGVDLPAGTVCRDDDNPCSDDVCDGAGICTHLNDGTNVCNGTVKSYHKISDTLGGFTGALDDEDQFGRAVASLGDLDGDGVGDIAVGTLSDDDGGTDRGAVWVLFLNVDGTVKTHQKISNMAGGFTGTLVDYDEFGASVASLGDLDGDGVDDLAVGAPGDGSGSGWHSGAAWVLFLNPNGTVKSHQKIGDGLGGFADTLGRSDSFGASVARLGDLDGDGVADLAVGAPYHDGVNSFEGAVWVLFLDTDGTVKTSQKINAIEGDFTGILSLSGEFGASVAGLGDLDGDGVVDLAVGAAQDHDGGFFRGAVWVLFLNPDGTVKTYQKISRTYGGLTEGGANVVGGFGSAVSALGDLDGDGVADLAVGAPWDSRGAVWVLFLNTDGTVKSHQRIGDHGGGFFGTLDDDDFLGGSVAALGDFDGDGVSDLVAGADYDDDGGFNRGAVWVLTLDGAPDECFEALEGSLCTGFANPCNDGVCDGAGQCDVTDSPVGSVCTDDGNPCSDDLCDGAGFCEHTIGGADVCEGTVKSFQKISAAQGRFLDRLNDFEEFGSSVASLGDLDGDGVEDLAVGAFTDHNQFGVVRILFLNADGTVKSHQRVNSAQSGFNGGDGAFGSSLAALGDLDGDGITDLAVGAYGDDHGAGVVWVLFLNFDGTVKSYLKIGENQGGFTGSLSSGRDGNDHFGSAVTSLGDLDGDGVVDIAVGAYTDRGRAGAVWVLFLNSDGTVKSHQKIDNTQDNTGGLAGGYLGSSIASLGDLDGDGVSDLAVGSFAHNDGGKLRGAVWIIFLNTDGTVKRFQRISSTQGGFTGELDDTDFFGSSVAAVGDLDLDGVVDLAVGVPRDDDGGIDRGAVWVLFLNADGTVKSHRKITCQQSGFIGGLDDVDEFGSSLAALRDLDGDGVVELAVGAHLDDDGGIDRGAMWVLFLEGRDECFGLADGTPCDDDGLVCTGDEACSNGRCKSSGNACTALGLVCNERLSAIDSIVCDCDDDDDCDDQDHCTEDSCFFGDCEHLEIPECRTGACCFSDTFSDEVTPSECVLAEGAYLGHNLTCTGDPDFDNVAGCDDGCPLDPNKVAPEACGCEMPDVDSDDDGFLDCDDACPELFGIVELSGCAPTGACCFDVGVCVENTNAQVCELVAGSFQGQSSLCRDECGSRPNPVFIQPPPGVTAVGLGDTVHISFEAGNGNDDDNIQWRLFYLAENDPRGAPADQLGTELLIGSGRLGSFEWDMTGLLAGSYRLGLTATDSGFSVARSVSLGFEHLIVTIPNDSAPSPTVRIDPSCFALQALRPPNCAIDARQPATMDGSILQGWNAMEMAVGPPGCILDLDDLSVDSLPDGPAPGIALLSRAGEVATITFDSVIPLSSWTCVSLTDDVTQQACIGNLPGDVSSNGISMPEHDLGALIDCINTRGSCMEWQENIDRAGGAAGVLDITRLIDLFNGAGSFQSFSGASFGGLACPSE